MVHFETIKPARCADTGKEAFAMKTVEVVAAVIREGNRVFATQRGYGPCKDGWEFPGGKIELGETPEQALIREIREELDAEITVGEKLCQVEYDYPDFHLSMGCYFCAVRAGRLTLREHEAAKWLAPDELDAVAWLPPDLEAVRLLKAAVPSYEYDAVLRVLPDGGAYVPFPWNIREVFGKGRVRVHAAFDGVPYDGSIVNMGVKNADGSVCYIIGVCKSIRQALRKGDGDTIHVVITERK